MKTLILKEAQAPYTLTLDETALAEGPVQVLCVDGEGERVIGIIVPPEEYAAFRAWRKARQRQQWEQQTREEFERKVAAFERMRPELLQEYRGRVVAIHAGQVVEVGDSKAEVSEQVYQRLGDVSVYIQSRAMIFAWSPCTPATSRWWSPRRASGVWRSSPSPNNTCSSTATCSTTSTPA
ncbi:MAG: hypothetical protein V3S14_02525 [Anaerolineae bacterium]